MGTLENFDLGEYGCDTFIETGTGRGEGLEYAKKFPFKQLYSFEINSHVFDVSQDAFDMRTQIFHSKSVDGLLQVLPLIQGKRILFWLDAHYPGADYGHAKYDAEPDMDVRLPLYRELETIIKHRGVKDVFIIDDVRIYDKGKIREYLPNVEFKDFDEGYAICQ